MLEVLYPSDKLDIEYDLDCDENNKFEIRYATAQRLIIQLFEMNLSFNNKYFDTFPLHTQPLLLLTTILRIYHRKEKIPSDGFEPVTQDVHLNNSPQKSDTKNREVVTVYKDSSSGQHSYSFNNKSKTMSINQMNRSPPSELDTLFVQHDNLCIKNTEQSQDMSTAISASPNPAHMSRKESFGLKWLREGYNLAAHSNSSSPITFGPSTMTKSISIELKALKILGSWVSKYFVDFHYDEKLMETLTAFIDKVIHDEKVTTKNSSLYTRALLLKHNITQAIEEYSLLQVKNILEISKQTSNDQSISSSTKVAEIYQELLRHEASEIACAITLLEIEVQKRINVRELLWECGLSKKEGDTSKTIQKQREFSNHIHSLVAMHVLSYDKSVLRAQCIEFWIRVAHEFFLHHNYNGAAIVVSAIGSNPIHRLKKSWTKVSKKLKQLLEDFNTIYSNSSNYANLKYKYENSSSYIPFIGPLITDLLRYDSLHKLYTPDGRINFVKMRSISKIISIVKRSTSFTLQQTLSQKAIEAVNNLFQIPSYEGTTTLMNLSKQREV